MIRLLSAAGALAMVLLVAGPAIAGPQDMANRVAAEVTSPFCDGVTLENCPSEEAVRLRATIAHKAAAGWSEARIVSWLENDYGVEAATPPRSGVGLLAWLLPALAVAAGIALLVTLIRRWTRRAGPDEEPAAAASPGDRARLDRELAHARRHS